MPVRNIETDEQLLERIGTDPAEWASAYQRMPSHIDGDAMHIQLAAWFGAAIQAGRNAERYSLAINLDGISEHCPLGAKEIGSALVAGRFSEFVAEWGEPALPDPLAETVAVVAARKVSGEWSDAEHARLLREELRSRGLEIREIGKGDAR